ncbi:tetratricopeptide repeat protein [Fusobacterium perfoetens]|uniref:tetratricopeptide repeat protein n=1 Tax=Fusobacterium perfoetens TaxID=852 RepID=UPI000481686B|nr:tetratricopeptide repeat protein [Fusobacterium perfoetens]
MKKFIFIAVLVNLFYSCQNLTSLNGGYGRVPELNMEVEKDKALSQEKFFLSDSGIAYFLDIVSSNIRNNTTRTYMDGNAFDLYLGEYIAIPTTAYNFTVLATPNVNSYDAFIRGGIFYFRSLYQGKFGFVLEKYGENSQTIVINNKAPYQISAFDLNNIISKNVEEQDIGKLKNSVQAFKILFPESSRVKDASFALFNQGVTNNDRQVVSSEATFLEENCQLSSEEKIKILLGREKVLNNDYALSKTYFNFKENTIELNEVIKNNIIKRGRPTAEELNFLEEFYYVKPSRELANSLGVFYFRSGNISKGTHYSENKGGLLPTPLKSSFTETILNNTTEGNTTENTENNNETNTVEENINLEYNTFISDYDKGVTYYKNEDYAEAILVLEKIIPQAKPEYKETQELYFLLGNSYYVTGNQSKAKEYLEKVTLENSKYPEAQYKLGDIYFKKGERAKAIKTFEGVSKNYNSTVWGRKSIIYLRSLK